MHDIKMPGVQPHELAIDRLGFGETILLVQRDGAVELGLKAVRPLAILHDGPRRVLPAVCLLEHAERPPDSIFEPQAVLGDQRLAHVALELDDLGDVIPDRTQDVLFGLAQRDLIRDLVEVAHCLAPFAVESTNGQADFLQAAKHLVDLPRDHQRRQVQHHAHPHAGAHIRRTGRQIAELIAVRVRYAGFDKIV